MLNIILDILALVLSLIAIFKVYRLSKEPSKWWLENQQAEQLESIKDLLGEQELSKALDIEHLDDEERQQLLVGRGNDKWDDIWGLLAEDIGIKQKGGDD